MIELAQSLVVAFVFAWVARAMLGAREITWRRMLLAAFAGITFGQGLAAGILARDLQSLAELDAGQVTALGLPFTLIGTMGAIVVLEVLFTRPPRRAWRLPRPVRAVRRWRGMSARGLEVVRIVTGYGLAPLLGLRRGGESPRGPVELARRARAALEDAGGVFVKLGQLLASRPDLLAPEVQAELGRLHARAAPIPAPEVERVMSEELGRPVDSVFEEVDWEPLGSASIAQAHRARLRDGRPVVVKVRRPGLVEVVERDLGIAGRLARTAERRTPWGRAYGVEGLVEEFSDVLRGELDFTNEARYAREVAEAVAQHAEIRVPGIVEELTTERMLVMELFDGTPLSAGPSLSEEHGRRLADALCASQVGTMLTGGRFHGDPHPGNLLLLEDGSLGLIDFGITGRLDSFERASVSQMLVALRLEEPSLLYEAMVTIGAVSAVRDPDEIERALSQFMAVHLGSGLPSPDAIAELLRLTTRLGLRLPRSASMMFRALATLAGTLEQLSPGYPLIEAIARIGGGELRGRMMPGSVKDLVQQEWAQLGPLVRRAPRHLDRIATLLEHGRLITRLRLFTDPEEVRVLERLVNRAVLAFLSIGIGGVSVILLESDRGPTMVGTDVAFVEVLGWLGLTVAVIILLRVLLAVLRSEQEGAR